MAEISLEQARSIVNDVRVENGGISEEARQRSDRETLQALHNVLMIAGNTTQLLTRELYSTNIRFVFELIQNAEDNSYSRARDRGEAPFVKFTLSHDAITIDSNEDGFTEEDVRAICKAGESTETHTGGYIGSKGIGFKSVFAIAYKVHIQSGPFSFYFEYRAGDSGMCMVIPHNQSHNDIPGNVITRITLSLTNPNDFEERKADFAEIPDTLMLFLRKLKTLSVSIEPREGRPSTTSYTRQESESGSRIHLIKSVNDAVTDRLYYVQRQMVSGLPQDESRSGISQAEVILAFPIDECSRLIIRPQHVYAFLPLRQEGLNFLVQSDFLTQANREGLRDSAWNNALRAGVCDAFVHAVHYFCSQPSLQYDWLAYLPGPHLTDPFWQQLREMIIYRLKSCRILISRGGDLYRPIDLRFLSGHHCDQHGQPLFHDIYPEKYLSPQYPQQNEYQENLISLGVANISGGELLDRLYPYLLGPLPRILEPTFDNEWHTRVATLLMRAMDSNSTIARVKHTWLIPLSDGSLASNETARIYFPDDTEGNAIPTDLGIRIVEREAIVNLTRRSLFERLGVSGCDPSFVIDRIRSKYNRPNRATLDNSVSHLRYLYRALPRGGVLDDKIYLMDHHETPIYPIFITFGQEIVVDDIYFETDGEYGTKRLAQKLMSGGRQQRSPRYELHFIHQSYLDAVPHDVRYNGISWKRWLRDAGGVSYVPTLTRSAMRLSHLFTHIINYQPELLVGLLKEYWRIYETEITPGIIEEIQNVGVPCQGASELVSLRSTYFPSAELRDLCSRMTIAEHFKLFLDIPTLRPTGTTAGWEFLETFNVGMQPDLTFFKKAIEVLTEIIDPGFGFFALYEELSARFFHTRYTEQIRYLFNEHEAIYIPTYARQRERSISLRKCVWKGAHCLLTKYALANYGEYSNNDRVEYLMRVVLSVQNADVTTYIDELNFHKNSSEVSLEDMCTIYEEIAELTQTEDSLIYVRNKFEQESLVYVPHERSWYQPRACVWAGAPKIGTQLGISTYYARLENFFLQGLLIQAPTAVNYVDQLQMLSQERPPNITDINTAIRNINQLLPTSTELRSIRSLKCLPVKMPNRSITLESAESQFFIADRAEYGSIFRSKVPILDYSLEEIHTLNPFLEALGLGNRFISLIIEEVTTVQHQDLEPSASLTRKFRQKSKHFTRCAIHYGGNRALERAAEILTVFRNASVYKSEGFTRTLKLSQGGLIATVESDSGLIHAEEVEGSLRLFVPRGRPEQSRSYATHLPKVLLRYLQITNLVATISLRNVILASIDDLDAVLDTDGIVQLPDGIASDLEFNISESSHSDGSTADSLTFTPSSSENQISPSHQTPYVAAGSIQNGVLDSTERLALTANDISEPRYEARPRPPLPSPQLRAQPQPSDLYPRNDIPPTLQSSYRRVLDKVIEVARRTASPLEGLNLESTAPPSSINNSLEGSPFGVRAQNPAEHAKKIGAAGELYVFELLLKLSLPGFDRSNWKSTIRHRVNIHPEYSDMMAWNGSETADIVYDDTNSVLTRLLIAEGALPRGQWETACPQYFIEVKSTISTCETQFYMSRSQYTRMQSMEIRTDSPRNPKVYIIFRVYYLGTDDMRVKIYVDPETSRKLGTLQFTPGAYQVTPARLFFR